MGFIFWLCMLLRFTTFWNMISVYHQEEMSSQAACCKHLPSLLSCLSGFSFSSTITDSLPNKQRLSVDFKLDDGLSEPSVKHMSQIEFGFFWHSHWFFYFLNCSCKNIVILPDGLRLQAERPSYQERPGCGGRGWGAGATDLVLRHRPISPFQALNMVSPEWKFYYEFENLT